MRASNRRHEIANFQTYSSENLGYVEVIQQDYHKLSQDYWVLKIVQDTIYILGPVTKIENIKADSTKILRPTHFSGPKDIKTD
jgi:hypothetical protein